MSYTPTQNITISYDASNHMHGEVLTYNSGTGVLTVDINHHTGSGTYAAWVVNVGGVTPATSVAWGGITGTLSAQTDLQNALDLKLAATTAASTYYLQTNPSGFITSAALVGYATESFVTTQGYITQATADGLYYPLSGNPSSFITLLNIADLNSDIAWDNSINLGRLIISGVETIGVGLSRARLNFGSTAPNVPATGDFWYNGTDFNYKDGGGVKTIASQSYVSATYQTLAGMSSYLTTASAAATYFTIASAANKADLASPTFTGTPTLPTGTIATTQSPGNNTTALATTAFVTAAVPAFATTAQVVAATSTTTALAPGNQGFALTNPRLQSLAFINQASVSGGGANATTTQTFSRQMSLATLSAGRSAYLFGAVGFANAGFGTSTAKADQVDFSKKVWISGYAMMGYSGSPSYLGDANTMCRITLGGYSTNTTGDMTLKGIGLKKAGGVASTVSLTVHNGTTRTDVASSVTVADGAGIQWQIYSDGTGNVTLYINGTQAATTTAGPTTATASGQGCYREQVEATVTPGVRQLMNCNGGWFYTE